MIYVDSTEEDDLYNDPLGDDLDNEDDEDWNDYTDDEDV